MTKIEKPSNSSDKYGGKPLSTPMLLLILGVMPFVTAAAIWAIVSVISNQ